MTEEHRFPAATVALWEDVERAFYVQDARLLGFRLVGDLAAITLAVGFCDQF